MANQPSIQIKPAINALEQKRLWIETYFQVRYKFFDRGSVVPLTTAANLASPAMSLRDAKILGREGEVATDTIVDTSADGLACRAVVCATLSQPVSIRTLAGVRLPRMHSSAAVIMNPRAIQTLSWVRVGNGVVLCRTVSCRPQMLNTATAIQVNTVVHNNVTIMGQSDLLCMLRTPATLSFYTAETRSCAAVLEQPWAWGPITSPISFHAAVMSGARLRMDFVARGVIMVRLAIIFISHYDDGSTLSDICANDNTIFDFVYDRRS